MVEHQPSKLDTWVRFPSPAYAIVIELMPESDVQFMPIVELGCIPAGIKISKLLQAP